MFQRYQFTVALLLVLNGAPAFCADANPTVVASPVGQCCFSSSDQANVLFLQQTLELYGIHTRQLAASGETPAWSLWVYPQDLGRSQDIVEAVQLSEAAGDYRATSAMGGGGCGQL